MTFKNICLLLLSSLTLYIANVVFAQGESTREVIQKAMRDEMTRNIQRLELENLERPFFISYTIRDAKTMEVTATLGSIVRSDSNHHRNQNVRVMVGDYSLNDENFLDLSGGSRGHTLLRGADRLPLEDDYDGIRRALWIATDEVYKRASEQYERKKTALEQQTLSEEEKALEDFHKMETVHYTEPPRLFSMERLKWEKIGQELSALFLDYPDIQSSHVRIYFYQSDAYFSNSEGTEVVQPLTLAMVHINASTQAVDGEPLHDHALFHALIPQDLPTIEDMKKDVKNVAENLIALRTAPIFEESYTGPVMFEGQAVSELFNQRLFTGSNGLVAIRKPVVADPRAAAFLSRTLGESLEDKIERRILSRDLTVRAFPKMDIFSGQKLIGLNNVDAEGVIPPEEILLVERGVLKTLLSNRIPTMNVKTSNGHQRPIIGGASLVSSGTGPSVISVETSNGLTETEMKDELLQLARDEGLEYAILVRKLRSLVSGAERRLDPMALLAMVQGTQQGPSLSEPIRIYRVSVEDGREELVRSVQLGGLPVSTLRRIAGAAQKRTVHNTLVPGTGGDGGLFSFASGFSREGIPASFLVPQSLIIEEMEVESEKRQYTPTLPVVPNPLLSR